eukprot:CAMPEP_0185755346 /NCGR_PEP_ID=MMETSP1174-20130828/13855_1 /TAXON_ID=35687 /ORGANISM="Dictyocha speculum, Strain CCMP1381" /LENGTH=262 /DNA_ID=CAMNT_0028433863 /DNA_START=6 /DNA_END=794 /DNA_ORIENTATION=+
MAQMSEEAMEVTVLVDDDTSEAHMKVMKDACQSAQSQLEFNLKIRKGSALSINDLRDAGANEADTVVILREESWEASGVESPSHTTGAVDSHTLTTLSLLEEILMDSYSQLKDSAQSGKKDKPVVVSTGKHLVAEFQDPRYLHVSREALKKNSIWKTTDLFVPEDLEAGALVQVSLEPMLANIYHDILSEPRFLNVELLSSVVEEEASSAITFGEVGQRIHASGGVLIGVQRTNGDGSVSPWTLTPHAHLCSESEPLIVLRR